MKKSDKIKKKIIKRNISQIILFQENGASTTCCPTNGGARGCCPGQ